MNLILAKLREMPLLWLLGGAAVGWVIHLLLRQRPLPRQVALLERIAATVSLVTLAAFAAFAVASQHSLMFEIFEADIVAIAAAAIHSQPVYHAITSYDYCYSMLYGPMTYVPYLLGLVVGQGRFWVLRTTMVVANLAIVGVMYSIFRKNLRWQTAVALTALPVAALFQYLKFNFGIRADAWIVLAVGLAVRSAMIDSPLAAAVMVGVWMGLGIDFKLTIAAIVPIVLLMLLRRHGVKATGIAVVVLTVVAMAPFAFPTVSLPNYFVWLRVAQHEGIDARFISFSIVYAAFLVLPLVLIRLCGMAPWPGRSLVSSWPEIVLLSVGLLLAIVVASKPGAGPWHFWQLLPIMAGYVALALGAAQPTQPQRVALVTLMLACGSLAVGAGFLQRDLGLLAADRQTTDVGEAQQEIEDYLRQYGDRSLQVGYSEDPGLASEDLRYLPILRGQPYTIDGSGRMEIYFQNFPPGILEKMKHCTNDVWLIPHGGKAFVTDTLPGDLHTIFVQHYAIERQGRLLDAWVCRPQ